MRTIYTKSLLKILYKISSTKSFKPKMPIIYSRVSHKVMDQKKESTFIENAILIMESVMVARKKNHLAGATLLFVSIKATRREKNDYADILKDIFMNIWSDLQNVKKTKKYDSVVDACYC